MFAYLDLGFAMLCALFGFVPVSLWGYLLVWMHLSLLWLVRCDHLWDTSPWCWYAWYTHFSTLCDVDMLAFLALCHPFGFLCFFASLHACLYVHPWVRVLSIFRSNGTMDTRSKPTFVLLGYPFLFDNMLVCPHLESFASLSFSTLSFYLFLCLSVGLFLLSLHVHAWSMDT